MPVIPTGQWRCFLCQQFGADGWRGFTRHYDTHHLGAAD